MAFKLDRIGHHKLLCQHFTKNDADSPLSYELLEPDLFPTLPRGDTEQLAKALLKRFGLSAKITSAAPRK
jgi:hypothetical protein